MKITFELEIEDWLAFQQNFLEHSKEFQKTKMYATLALPAMFMLIILYQFYNDSLHYISLCLYAAVSSLWIVYYPKQLERSTLKKARKMFEEGDNSSVLGQHEITFNAQGLQCTYPGSEQHILWDGIKRVEETEEYYFLYLSALNAVVIPKKKVGTDRDALKDILKTHLEQSSH